MAVRGMLIAVSLAAVAGCARSSCVDQDDCSARWTDDRSSRTVCLALECVEFVEQPFQLTILAAGAGESWTDPEEGSADLQARVSFESIGATGENAYRCESPIAVDEVGGITWGLRCPGLVTLTERFDFMNVTLWDVRVDGAADIIASWQIAGSEGLANAMASGVTREDAAAISLGGYDPESNLIEPFVDLVFEF